jgi:hypothetical protein
VTPVCRIRHLWDPAYVSTQWTLKRITAVLITALLFVLDLLISINCVHDSSNSSTQHLTQPLCTLHCCEGQCSSWNYNYSPSAHFHCAYLSSKTPWSYHRALLVKDLLSRKVVGGVK